MWLLISRKHPKHRQKEKHETVEKKKFETFWSLYRNSLIEIKKMNGFSKTVSSIDDFFRCRTRRRFKSLTGRPLSPGIFSAKNVTYHHGFEQTTSCLPGRRTTH